MNHANRLNNKKSRFFRFLVFFLNYQQFNVDLLVII